MLSEGIHSLVDTSNEGVLMIGVRQARQPPDELHQFGHGKVLYFWTFVVAVLLFAVGGGLAFYEGVSHLFDPHPVENAIASYVVLAVSLVLELASSWVAARELAQVAAGGSLFRAVLETKDASVLAVLAENAAAIAGLLLAFLGLLLTQLTGDPRFDALGSLAVGVVLVAVAIFVAAESRALVIGEAASATVVTRARQLIEEDPAVERICSLRTMHIGPEHVVMTASVQFTDGPTTDIPRAIERISQRLASEDATLSDVTIQPAARALEGPQ